MSNTPQTLPTGRDVGCGSDGRGARGRGRGRHYGRAGHRRFAERKFEGMEPTLKGKVFDYIQETQAKQYTENVEAIMRYISTNYKHYTADLVRSVEVLPLDMPDPINDPAEGASAIDIE